MSVCVHTHTRVDVYASMDLLQGQDFMQFGIAHLAVSVGPHPHLMLEQGRNSGTRDQEQAGSHRHMPHAPQRPTEAHECTFSSHLGEEGVR